jgi:hypothetical protein
MDDPTSPKFRLHPVESWRVFAGVGHENRLHHGALFDGNGEFINRKRSSWTTSRHAVAALHWLWSSNGGTPFSRSLSSG